MYLNKKDFFNILLVISYAEIGSEEQAPLLVVETRLLASPSGAALVLANYTYQPIQTLTVDVRLPAWQAKRLRRAISTEGKPVRLQKIAGGVRLTLTLEWTDIVLLPAK